MNSTHSAPEQASVVRESTGRLPLVQEHQVEARLALFAAWCAPGLTRWEDPYDRATFTYFLDAEGDGVWARQKRPLNLWRALAAHIAAGAGGEPEVFRDDRDHTLCALGLAYDAATPTRLLNLDLDGAHADYDPAAIVAILRTAFEGRVLVTSSSGKPGKFRALVPIVPMRVDELVELVSTLLEAVGFPARKGGVEIYPSTTNGRLPFGLGGCTLYPAGVRGLGERHHPYVLLDRLRALEPVNLVDVLNRATPASAPVRARPRFDIPSTEPGASVAPPIDPSPGREVLAALVAGSLPRRPSHPTRNGSGGSSPSSSSSTTSSPTTSTPSRRHVRAPDPWRAEAQLGALVRSPPRERGARLEKSTHYPKLWSQGVTGEGQRDEAEYLLIRDGYYRYRSEARNAACVQAWMRDGGIARSKAAQDARELEARIADIPRKVGIVHRGTVRVPKHPRGRPPAAHLSAGEILRANDLVERRARLCPGVPKRQIHALLFHALPVLKGAVHAGLQDLLIHWTEWAAWAGHEYAEVRAAAGIFEATTGYLSQRSLRQAGRNPGDAHAMKWWAPGFEFDPPKEAPPRRPLGRCWSTASLAAQHALARTTRRAAGRSPALAGLAGPAVGMTGATHRRTTGKLMVTTGMQSSAGVGPGGVAACPAVPPVALPVPPPVTVQTTGHNEPSPAPAPAPAQRLTLLAFSLAQALVQAKIVGVVLVIASGLYTAAWPRKGLASRLAQQARQRASVARTAVSYAARRRSPQRARRRPRRAHDPDP